MPNQAGQVEQRAGCASAHQHLATEWAPRTTGKVLAVGVGNELRADDAAGLRVAGLLAASGACQVLVAEEVPENYLDPMLRAQPDTIIFCDAVDLGREPGAFALLDVEDLAGRCVSTHNPSLRLLGRCLRAGGVRNVLVAAIQPQRIGWGQGLSPAVQAGAEALAATLVGALRAAAGGTRGCTAGPGQVAMC